MKHIIHIIMLMDFPRLLLHVIVKYILLIKIMCNYSYTVQFYTVALSMLFIGASRNNNLVTWAVFQKNNLTAWSVSCNNNLTACPSA